MNNNYTVYMHTAPNGKKYIGITCMKVEKRWGRGVHYKNNEYFYRAICLYGWDEINHEVLLPGIDKEEAERKEIELIKLYKSNNRDYGYNIKAGGILLGRCQ